MLSYAKSVIFFSSVVPRYWNWKSDLKVASILPISSSTPFAFACAISGASGGSSWSKRQSAFNARIEAAPSSERSVRPMHESTASIPATPKDSA